MTLTNVLKINTIFFSVLGYQMSYLEFVGTIFTALSVYFAVRNKTLTWPFGILGSILYLILFYQIQLYSDFFEQVYFIITSILGWWVWTHPKGTGGGITKSELKISVNNLQTNTFYIGATVLLTVIFALFFGNIHKFLPALFPIPASYPLLDAFTTVMSFLATILLIKKKIENWYLWILVDVIGIGLYFAKDVMFLALLYAAFLIMAIKGYLGWRKELLAYEQIN